MTGKFTMLHILLYTGLILFIINYSIGWSLHYGIIHIRKFTHQVIFSLILINLAFLLFFLKTFSSDFYLCSVSLLLLSILPMGKKGGIYHRVVSSLSLVMYVVLIVIL
jgi:hypothetical protein